MDPRRLLPALAVVTLVCLVLTGVQAGTRHWSADDPAPDPRRTTRPAAGPAQVLAAWDRARAAAWAEADVAGLRELYVASSSAGQTDVAMLREWSARGLRVTGLETQVLSLRVRVETPDRLVLVVTDRVVGGEAVGQGAAGRAPVRLPRDQPSTRRVELEKVGGEWLMAEVRDQPVSQRRSRSQASAVASTSRTSSSSKS